MTPHVPAPSKLLRAAASCLALGLALLAVTARAEDPVRSFDLPADAAEASLRRFSDRTGLEVLYESSLTKGVETRAVKGDYTPAAALDAMLAGTGLEAVEEAGKGAFSLRREAARRKTERTARAADSSRPPARDGRDDEQTLRLDPFEVRTDHDTSYGALNSNSITRFNTELDKVPISADIFTSAFMEDVDATNVNDLLSTYGAGIGVVLANASGAGFNSPGDAPIVNAIGVRGLGGGQILRNGFAVEPENNARNAGGAYFQSSFDVDRVEVLRGPQGLLYGAGGAGGTIVATTKEAHFDQASGSIGLRIDQFGSKREVADLNEGNDWAAARVVLLNEDDQYAREFLFAKDRGTYSQLAFRLPLRTTLKVDAEYLVDDRNLSDNSLAVNLGSGDPRNGAVLEALLFHHDTGAVNPATGQPWSNLGAIDNGHVNWDDVASYGGWRGESVTKNLFWEAIADTVWADWLSTEVGVNYNNAQNKINQSIGSLTAPGVGGNPTGGWAINSNLNDADNFNRHEQARAAALFTKNFLSDRIKTQTAVGGDIERQGFGTQAMSYYAAEQSGNLALTGSAVNLGRVAAPVQWWSVDNGPVFHPAFLPPMGTPLWYSQQDGRYYVRQERDPRNAAWVTPINPLGLGQLFFPAADGVSGNDIPDYANHYTISGAYAANYTSWIGDYFNSLVGFRRTETANHIPNVSSLTATVPYDTSKRFANSYNFGLDGRITQWLRWYGSLSANYNNPLATTPPGGDDPYGNPPVNSRGKGQEVGLKFTPLAGRISGSFDFYSNQSKDDTTNQIAATANINPPGLNGQFQGAFGAGTAVPVNYTSNGLELIVTANPTPNWRIRFAATTQNGKVATSKSYPILYNDQFFTDGKGDVTYRDGSPFLVPATPGSSVSGLSTNVDPAAILNGAAAAPLTTQMIGDPSSPYYAWQGTTVAAAGNIAPNSNVGRVLKYFTKPGVGTALTGVTGLPIGQIQYAWPDPNATHGIFVVTQSGQSTVGYPVYRINLTNAYEIPTGIGKGLGAVLSVNNAWQYRTYYYNAPNDPNLVLYRQPELGWQINLNPYWRHKFGRILFRTQVDINNLTNHYILSQPPGNGSGLTLPLTYVVRYDGQPRSYAWTNTISF